MKGFECQSAASNRVRAITNAGTTRKALICFSASLLNHIMKDELGNTK